jgi:hypothetical protein
MVFQDCQHRRIDEPTSSGNHHAPIHGCHLGTFGIADHDANQESSRLEIEAGFDVEPGLIDALQRCVPQTQFEDFLLAHEQGSILVKNSRRKRQVVMIPVLGLAEFESLGIEVHNHGEANAFLVLEELCLALDGKFAHFLLREDGPPDFLFRRGFGIGFALRSEITMASLQRPFLLQQRYF